MRFDRQLLKGTTESILLGILAMRPGHGYQLADRLKRQSEGIFELGQGTIYPLLYKLEAKGWIEGKWEAGSGRRRRRVYRITPRGRRQLAQRAQQWQKLVLGMSLVIGETAYES